MKLLAKRGDAFTLGSGEGEVSLLPQEIEDLWHAYNLLAVGDAVVATTFRKVVRESSTGSVDSQKTKMTLRVQLKSIDFDPEGGELRLGGTVWCLSPGSIALRPASAPRPGRVSAAPARGAGARREALELEPRGR